MSKFLANIFYRKKVKRLEKLTLALQRIGEGDLRGANTLVQQARPTEYTEDLGLYYFVKGRIAMELLEIEKGENYLTTAWALGFRKGAIFVSLALAKGRLRRLGEALELLEVGRQYLAGTDEVEVIDMLEQLIGEVAGGSAAKQISMVFANAAKSATGKSNPRELKERDWKKLMSAMFAEASGPEVDDVQVAVLGAYMVAKHHGVWEYGLEMTDHAVLVKGVAYRPASIIRGYYAGTISLDEIGSAIPRHSITSLYLDEEGMD